MIAKRATKKLREAGLFLEVQKYSEGFVLIDPRLNHQRGICHPTAEEAVKAALAGERPQEVTGRGPERT